MSKDKMGQTTELNWLKSETINVEHILTLKKKSRLNKNKIFNGIVLEQKSKDANNEFKTFLDTLKKNIHQIPSDTRMSLAIRTLYYDKDHDTNEGILDGTKNDPNHWTAVDLLIDSEKNIHSFVLDAANCIGYKEIHTRLKESFPQGQHYILEEDTIEMPDGKKKNRIIQTRARGCHVFTLSGLFELSKIDTPTLYYNELPRLAQNNALKNGFKVPTGVIQPGDFIGKALKVSRIFIPTQSLSTLESLDIQDNNGDKLIDKIKHINLSPIDNKKLNLTIESKNTTYLNKEIANFHVSKRNREQQTFIYLRNGCLFKITHILL